MCLQEAGAGGAAGPSAVTSVAAESRCAAACASLRMASVRASLRRDGPATLSPASVSSGREVKVCVPSSASGVILMAPSWQIRPLRKVCV